MAQDETDHLDEIRRMLAELTNLHHADHERLEAAITLIEEIHRAWCLEVERVGRVLPEAVTSPVGPGTRVSWTDPLDASNAAWSGTVEFVGVDQEGAVIAHVDFGGYGRRNLPVDELIIGILT
jgi:hypothetical protein